MTTARWRAPGRVNLIGEHTDYNGGLALPFALPQGCTATVSLAHAGLEVSSAQVGATLSVDLGLLADAPPWTRYVAGPAAVLARQGVSLPGLRIQVDSDVPLGAGLSSSAAVVCAVTCALDDALGLDLSPSSLLDVARRAENEVVGAPTGGLDQLASLQCVAGSALLIDFADWSSTPVPLVLGEHTVLVVDTGVRHSHADGEYAERRRACSEAAALLGVPWLSAARLPLDLPAPLLGYARHVLSENDRVRSLVAALAADDLAAAGSLLSASHASLRDDFRVTSPELDLACTVLEDHGALGARMTGGGFGGSVIALVPLDAAPTAGAAVVRAFAEAGFPKPHWFTTAPADGAHRVA